MYLPSILDGTGVNMRKVDKLQTTCTHVCKHPPPTCQALQIWQSLGAAFSTWLSKVPQQVFHRLLQLMLIPVRFQPSVQQYLWLVRFLSLQPSKENWKPMPYDSTHCILPVLQVALPEFMLPACDLRHNCQLHLAKWLMHKP